ncbi:MAG: ribonuclease HII [Coraliomargarita sp.]
MNDLQQHDSELLTDAGWLVGIDEAGRGPLAGPVVAGACVLSGRFFESTEAVERSGLINDSKQLSEASREAQFALLCELREEGLLDFETALGSVEEIAELNILGATRLAMRRAVEAIAGRAAGWCLPELAASGPLFADNSVRLIVDGRPLKPFPYVHEGLVKGDGKSLAIAMASVAAKVVRDREMQRLAEQHPQYGFDGHKGYGTKAHREALLEHGPSPVHRALFLRKILAKS